MRGLRYLTGLLALVALLAPRAADAQTTYTLAPTAKQQFFDSNGDPVPGGKLCTYLAGTTTAATTYLDTAGTQNTNPIMLNAAGRPTNGGNEVGIYLAAGSTYKFVLMTAGTDTTCATGTTVWTQDGVGSVPASSSSVDIASALAGEALTLNQCVYLSDGSGSKTSGRWYKCDAANTYSSTLPEVGIALATATIGQTLIVRTSGLVTGLSGLSVGAKYYASATAGLITSTAPPNRRELGQADTTTSLVLAPNPSSTTWTAVTTTATGTQNDFAPGLNGNTIIRCNNASDLTITGLAGGYSGQLVIIQAVNASANVFLAHQSASSTVGNRLVNAATSGNTPLAGGGATTGGFAMYYFDASATNAWRLVQHEQGAWITPTFAAGTYTANGSMTWTLDSADVTTQAYWLKGRSLTVSWFLVSTTVGGVVNTNLQIGNAAWGTFTAAKSTINPVVLNDNGGGNAIGFAQINATGTLILLNKVAAANWTLAANNTNVLGQITFEVQ